MNEHDNWDLHWLDYDVVSRYNPAQIFRRELLVHWLSKQIPAPKSRMLDIGSGQGDLIAIVSRLFPEMELAGIEMSVTGIRQSQAKTPQALFCQRDLQYPPLPDDPLLAWANLAVCSEVLEHVDNPRQVLSNASQYLVPGGRLFITVPGGPISAFDRHIGHRQHFNKTSLYHLISDAGLLPETVRSVGFPFFNLYKLTVILRGKALISDANSKNDVELNWIAKMAMKAFSVVLKRKLNTSLWGWQMTAQAKMPG